MEIKYNFVPNWSQKQVIDAINHYGLQEWVQSGSRGRKRLRIVTLCHIYHTMEIEQEYLLQNIAEQMMNRDVQGMNSMTLSTQRVGYFLSLYCKKGFLEKRRGKLGIYYRRVY